MSLVEVKGLFQRFGKKVVLRNINLSIEPGEIFGIIGPDGAGKTTLLRVIGGVLPGTAEILKVSGVDLLRYPEAVKERIGVVPQNFSLYRDLTVEENLHFFQKLYMVPDGVFLERKQRLLEIFRLDAFQAYRAENLSGGMQKKLALITSLLHTPPLLILDEPTCGVDPVSRRELWDFLYELFEGGTTIIISTPYMDEAERCTKVGFMYNGEILLIDEPSSIKKNYKYQVIEIKGTDVKKAGELSFPGELMVQDVYPVGDMFHLVTSRTGTDEISAFLKDNNCAVVAKRVEPSFEDAFIALIREKRTSLNVCSGY